MTAVGDELRRLRTNKGLSLRALAAQSGVSNPYLSQIERGEKEPSARILRAVAAPLDVDEQHLLVLAGVIGGRTGSTEAAITNDPELTHNQRTALLEVYKAFVARHNT